MLRYLLIYTKKQWRISHISDGKSSQTVVDFVVALEQQKGNKEQVKSVSCDMSPAFIKGHL